MRYRSAGTAKANGVDYTPSELAGFAAREMLNYFLPGQADNIIILDPAAGRGSLLIALIKALESCGRKIHAVGYETDADTGRETARTLAAMFPAAEIEIRIGDFLEAAIKGTAEKYDLIIANPPYIRTQIMGSRKAQDIAEKLSLSGRIDIYYAFLLCAGSVLKEGGIAGFITSNKFMTVKAGAAVRNFLLSSYRLHRIVDFGDTKIFKAAVLPCLTIFSKGKTDDGSAVSFTSVYQCKKTAAPDNTLPIGSIFELTENSGYYAVPDGRVFRFRQGRLNFTSETGIWSLASEENRSWLARVKANTWLTFSQIGKIRVGIKTAADNVFIGDKWGDPSAEPELLRPLITHRNAGQIIGNNAVQWKVLYTHCVKNGKRLPYVIEDYPKTRAYLFTHFDRLSAREYIKKAKRKWYEIWIPQDPEAWAHKKIVFRDISEKPEFWLDSTGAVVNGDCYWIDIEQGTPEEVVYLALAVANSAFIEKYYDVRFNAKLYSGKRRYQKQYVEHFPIPHRESSEARRLISIVKRIISEGSREFADFCKPELDALVEKLFS